MQKKTKAIVNQVIELVEPVLADLGFELVDAEHTVNQGRWILRLYMDREGGVTLDDCARVSNELGDLLDVKDLIEHEYILEVSSPGLNRPLRKEKDFSKVIGKKIKVKMSTFREGRQNYTGCLKAFNEGMLHMDVDGKETILPWSEMEKAHLIYEFD
ncbi:MAG: ribosome maturation factor RimP [Desulfobacteraceae bacterium]|nr:MAG: ribosome maturation factor RimP [Desulfobacteraceae bacterium]